MILKIGIIGKKNEMEVYDIARDLSDWLVSREIEVVVEKELAKGIDSKNGVEENEIPGLVDIVVVLGGDGTFLGVSRLVNEYEIPLLGVNLGGLGFLTEFTVKEIYPMMERVISGDYEIEDREMISVNVYKDEKKFDDYLVLNDVVVKNGPVSRIVDLAIYIDGSHITTFRADGIIFSTPTGSTAYSLSAGGPIVYPTLPVIIITPICPHILNNRPLVVTSDSEIRVKALTDTQTTSLNLDSQIIYLTLDGQTGVTLNMNDEVVLKRSSSTVKLIKSPFRDYFTILKTKLMWGKRYGSISG